jgi:hypothetical protein
MARIARALAALVLLIASFGLAGCLHTWAQTYQDYPPAAWEPRQPHVQANPNDG